MPNAVEGICKGVKPAEEFNIQRSTVIALPRLTNSPLQGKLKMAVCLLKTSRFE